MSAAWMAIIILSVMFDRATKHAAAASPAFPWFSVKDEIHNFVFPLMCDACGQVWTLYRFLHGLRLKVKGVRGFDL